MTVHTVIILFALTGGILGHATDFKQGSNSDYSVECVNSGLICDGCESSYYCVLVAPEEFVVEKIEDCPSGSTCLESTGRCTTGNNLKCNQSITNDEFKCHQIGLFPNVFDCTSYHVCLAHPNGTVDPIPRNYYCDIGYGYNPLTTLCSVKLSNEGCPSRSVNCMYMYQSGVIDGHPSMYYICLTGDSGSLYPFMYVCPNGMEFIDETCVDISPPIGIENEKCLTEGMFYNPSDCRKFFICPYEGGSPISWQCGLGDYFDHNIRDCRGFDCPK
ncbi:uncharacterized protein LOC143911105 [Arctopsyche grandis]|uniref:uncharacterized protein LOC143911105 n=1 Tax=Arctopsyche grandis TaxID=121162 RepID=UPI00406D86B0